MIDHHLYQNDLFDLAYIVTNASSSAELTYDLIRTMGAPVTPEIAEPLYCGLVADTGSFAFEATSPKAHRIAAELVEAGAKPQKLWRQLNCQKSLLKMKVLGTLLAGLESDPDGRIVWCSIDLEFLQTHGIEARDSFEIVNYFLFIKGVEAGPAVHAARIGQDEGQPAVRGPRRRLRHRAGARRRADTGSRRAARSTASRSIRRSRTCSAPRGAKSHAPPGPARSAVEEGSRS